MNRTSSVQTALIEHARRIGMSEDTDPPVLVFLFLLDVIAYCAENKINLDADQRAAVRTVMNQGANQ